MPDTPTILSKQTLIPAGVLLALLAPVGGAAWFLRGVIATDQLERERWRTEIAASVEDTAAQLTEMNQRLEEYSESRWRSSDMER